MNKRIFTLRSVVCSLLLSIMMPAALLQAYPYFYRRLILEQDGQVIKIVDLISDIHASELAPSLKPISDLSNIKMGPSDKALIEALRKIGNRSSGEIVELFVECSPEGRPFYEALMIEALPYIGVNFHREFNRSQEKRLIYSDADTYRGGGLFEEQYAFNLLKNDNLIENDLRELQSRIDRPTFRKIDALWKEFREHKLQPYCKWLSSAESATDVAKKGERSLEIGTATMDLEIIINIFKSPHRHNIVYAGGLHCTNICDWLEKQFNFHIVESAGTELAPKKLFLSLLIEHGNLTEDMDQLAEFFTFTTPLPTYIWDQLHESIQNNSHAPQPRYEIDSDEAFARQLQEEEDRWHAAAADEIDPASQALIQRMLEEEEN